LQIMSEMLDLTMVCRRVGKSATLAERRSNEVCSAAKSKEKSRKRILGEWI
jgi:hypothetical protein